MLRGGSRQKHEHRHVQRIGRSGAETAAVYPASLVATVTPAIKRKMVSDGAVKVEEMAHSGPVPDEGDHSTEVEWTWSVDRQWIDTKLLEAGREEEIEYMKRG